MISMNTPTLTTALYSKPLNDVGWDVAHLYEHLVIARFKKYVHDKGYSGALYGWVSGETFPAVIFIEAGFYDPAVKSLFDTFMQSEADARIDLSMLDHELERLQAEEQAVVKKIDLLQLKSDLLRLDAQPFLDHEKTTSASLALATTNKHTGSSLALEPTPNLFVTNTVIVSLSDASTEDNALFLRLTPPLFAIIEEAVNAAGGYVLTYEDTPSYNQSRHGVYEVAQVSFRSTRYDSEALGTELTKAIACFDAHSRLDALNAYREGFEKTETWSTLPIDYYRSTGILTSRHQIATNFTPEKVTDVIRRVIVTIEN